MIGIFDSGLGGLTVLRRVRAELPDEPLLYFADQAHVPYGDRSDAVLRNLLARNVAYLEAQGADFIVMGCNTSCAIGRRYGWPRAGVPILDLIDAAAEAVAALGARRIGVIATSATAKSGAYGEAIRARLPGALVQEVAAPELVPLVEAGKLTGPIARDAVVRACAPFLRPLDVLVLACTHFPLLDEHFAAAFGPGLLRLDPAVAQAARAVAFARGHAPQLALAPLPPVRTRFVTNGPLPAFAAAVRRIVGALQETEQTEEQDDGDETERRSGYDLHQRVRA
jgi:glutamate racemase